MISFPARVKQGRPDASPLSSRPQSPSHTPSPSISSFDPPRSATSSTFFLNDNRESSITLPEYPKPSFLRQSSSSLYSSDSDEFDGATACPTPNIERGFEHKISISKSPLRSVNSFQTKFEAASYNIETLDRHDDVEFLPPWKRRLYRLSPIFTFLAVAAYFLYYAYRIHCTGYAQRAYHKTYVMAWLFIAAEGCVACQYHLFYLIQI
jgi:hypothetical protein